MGEGGGVGQEVEEGSGFGGRRGGFGFDGWASGGVGDAEGLPTLALVEVVVGDGLRDVRLLGLQSRSGIETHCPDGR